MEDNGCLRMKDEQLGCIHGRLLDLLQQIEVDRGKHSNPYAFNGMERYKYKYKYRCKYDIFIIVKCS